MKRYLLLIIAIILLLSSCQKREWNNPFDVDNTTFSQTIISTSEVTDITAISVICGGNISSNGTTITERGICYSTTQNPSTSDTKVSIGSGTGSFSNTIIGLTANTTYYIRAYATNSQGTIYGNEVSFKTEISSTLASITTSIPFNITSNSATLGGNIINDGNASVTERGICYSTNQNPNTSDSKMMIGNGIGTFDNTVIGLVSNTNYYARAYAINIKGTAYGTQVSFKTNSIPVLTIGQSYQGGKIAYILQPGDPGYIAGQIHGLIAAPSDQSSYINWYNGKFITTGASGIDIGTGNANTNAIISIQGTGNYAANLCHDLVIGVYNDWYLPSKNELNLIYLNKIAIGGFLDNFYWSSSESISNSDKVWVQDFSDGFQDLYYKGNICYVRAVRSF